MTEGVRLIEALRKDGAGIFRRFVSGSELEALRAEWDSVLPTQANYRYGFGLCARYSLGDLPPSLAATANLFSGHSLIRFVADGVLGSQHGYMEVVAFTHEFRRDEQEIYGRLHFDRKRQVKFILYLDDTSEECGAFRYLPGSTHVGRRLRQDRWRVALHLQRASGAVIDSCSSQASEGQATYSQFDCSVSRADLAMCGFRGAETVLTGAAGTLVAFDTDVLHRGGMVTPGYSRRSIKGHCFPEPQLAGEAWQSSPRCAAHQS